MKIQFENKNIVVFESAIYRTTSVLFFNDDFMLLIDPNYLPIEIEFIQEKVKCIRKSQELFLLFTHSDYDHIVGYEYFDADKTIASQLFSSFKDQQLKAVQNFDKSLYVLRPQKLNFPILTDVISVDEQSISTQNNNLTFYLAPGHTADGLITLLQPENYLFVGDYLSNIEFPFIADCPTKYLKTLDKIEQIIQTNNIKLLVVGHGDCLHDKKEMLVRIEESRNYINYLFKNKDAKVLQEFENKLAKKYPFFDSVKEHHEKNIKKCN